MATTSFPHLFSTTKNYLRIRDTIRHYVGLYSLFRFTGDLQAVFCVFLLPLLLLRVGLMIGN